MRYTDDELKIEAAVWNAAREVAIAASNSISPERRLQIAIYEFAAALLNQFGRDHAQQIVGSLRDATTTVEKWSNEA